MHQKLPNSHLTFVDDAGHSMWEPNLLNQLMEDLKTIAKLILQDL
ncbi:hypothetical protein [Mycoplasmopsis gallopavonis]|nr:hypothetical protein [Mycoplasmopsis gallopavonis]